MKMKPRKSSSSRSHKITPIPPPPAPHAKSPPISEPLHIQLPKSVNRHPMQTVRKVLIHLLVQKRVQSFLISHH